MSKSPTVSNSEELAPFAIIEASGQQFWLQANRYYDLDRINAKVDETITIKDVLLINDGKKTTLGQPYVKGASVELTVMAHRRGPKVIVYKMRPKKKTRRKNGHRQELTRVVVQSISTNSNKTPSSTETKSTQPKKNPTANKSTEEEKVSKTPTKAKQASKVKSTKEKPVKSKTTPN